MSPGVDADPSATSQSRHYGPPCRPHILPNAGLSRTGTVTSFWGDQGVTRG